MVALSRRERLDAPLTFNRARWERAPCAKTPGAGPLTPGVAQEFDGPFDYDPETAGTSSHREPVSGLEESLLRIASDRGNPSAGEERTGESAVFVVDDDERMRNALSRLLTSAGPGPARFFDRRRVPANRAFGSSLLSFARNARDEWSAAAAGTARSRRSRSHHLSERRGHDRRSCERHQGRGHRFVEEPFQNDDLIARIKHAVAGDREALHRDRRGRRLPK